MGERQEVLDIPVTVFRPDYKKGYQRAAGRGRPKPPASFRIKPGHVTVKALRKLKVECPCEWHAAKDGKGHVRYIDYVLEEAFRKAERLAALPKEPPAPVPIETAPIKPVTPKWQCG